MNKEIIKPSQQHYQEILRAIIGIFVVCTLFYIREFGGTNDFTDFLQGRHAISEVGGLVISGVLGILLAFGVDRALLPLLKKVSSKPPIELIPNGIRYLYNKAHADILFVDIECVDTKQEPIYCIELRTKSGQNIELSGYSDMKAIEAHLKQGI